MRITRTQLAWLLSDLLIEAIEGSSKDNPTGCRTGGKTFNPEYSGGIMGYSTECPPEQSFYTCDHMSVQKCGVDVNGTSAPFSCEQEAKSFMCDSTIEINGRPPFECGDQSKFQCSDTKGFDCTGKFKCGHSGNYQCDADVFQCNNAVDPLVFECVHNTSDFDCVRAGLYDFNCNRQPQGDPDAFNCPTTGQPPIFECTVQHIFGCFEKFNCPSSHTCSSPEETALTCDDEHPWEPDPDRRDDGNPGDFDCCVFTCGASRPDDEEKEKFDCTTESDFKCLDGTEVSEGRFQCGIGSEFECGEEKERYVCMDYRCSDNFHCESAFHCGNQEKGREYECSLNNFQCRQVPGTDPAEVGYACDSEGENIGGYTCEVYNCDQEGYRCNPPNEFAGCGPSTPYAVPEPWP